MAGWSIPPTRFIDQIEADLVRLQVSITMALVSEVISNSAIDSGNYMGNHIVSIGAPDYTVNTNLDVQGTVTKGLAQAKLVGLKPYQIIYVQNNSEYGEVLEFGGYRGPTVKVTSAGFSRMAPKGTYGISFIAVSERFT